jgi:subtilisin
MPAKKRFLVTHSETNQSISPVAQILNLPVDNIRQGVNFLATEKIPREDDVLEFPSVGITSASLDEAQVRKLKENPNILAVEEDVEMYVLEIPATNAAEADLIQEQVMQVDDKGVTEAYQKGFREGVQQYMQQVAQLFQNQRANAFQSFPGSPVLLPGFDSIGTLANQPIPWTISMVKAPAAWARGIRGAGIRVAVLDTGIAAHPDLNPISGGISFVPGVVSFNDGHGHGTHCAGIIGARDNAIGVVGVAPACSLYAVKVLSDAGSGNSSWIIAGMDWAASAGMHVVSMSLGGLSGPSVAYANAVKRLQDRGTAVCIASGNSFGTAFPWVNSPGNSIITGVPNASPIAVGSININKVIAPSSSRGGQVPLWNQVTVVAPGVNINSTIPGGIYGLKSGTSMATPHVAGAAALLKQRFPGITPASIKLKLRSTAQDLGLAGNDITYGSGLINCDLATV